MQNAGKALWGRADLQRGRKSVLDRLWHGAHEGSEARSQSAACEGFTVDGYLAD